MYRYKNRSGKMRQDAYHNKKKSRMPMKITVIKRTEIKGCTYHIKESFLEHLRAE